MRLSPVLSQRTARAVTVGLGLATAVLAAGALRQVPPQMLRGAGERSPVTQYVDFGEALIHGVALARDLTSSAVRTASLPAARRRSVRPCSGNFWRSRQRTPPFGWRPRIRGLILSATRAMENPQRRSPITTPPAITVAADRTCPPPLPTPLVFVLFLAVYVLAGTAGLGLAFFHSSASPVWPPTGVALAALLLYGTRLWPAVFAGAFLVNVTTVDSVATSLRIAAGNALEALTGAWLVNRFAGGWRCFERSEDLFRFAALTCLGAGSHGGGRGGRGDVRVNRRKFSPGMILAGAAALICGCYTPPDCVFLRAAQFSEGAITRVEAQPLGCDIYHYRYQIGRETYDGTHHGCLPKGQQVPDAKVRVAYDPNDPAKSILDSGVESLFGPCTETGRASDGSQSPDTRSIPSPWGR